MTERTLASAKKPEIKKENQASRSQQTNFSQSLNTPVDRILFLQRTIGNQAVGRLIKSGVLKTKLRIGQPGDIYEQEAERVADQVMRMQEPKVSTETKVSSNIQNNSIQRRCPACIREHQSRKEEGEETLQTKENSDSTPKVTSDLESSISSIHGSGQPLSEPVRTFFERRFGADFSSVRVSSDSQAGELANTLQAKAFTVGSNISFGRGQYSPGTSEGKQLLAHELTHVIQQTGSVHSQRILRARIDSGEKTALCNTAACDLLPPAADITDNQAIFRKEIDDFQRTPATNSRASGSIRQLEYMDTGARQKQLPDIQRQHKLENDLGSATGVACPISTEKLNHQNASLDITFDLGGSVLTAQDINNIAVFVNNWHGASISVPVRIHGYASKDGPPTVNWPLSCHRAEAVSKQMQKVQPAVVLSTGQSFPAGTPGILAGFTETFAHGETEEFSKTALPPNRRATVHVPSLPALPAKVAKAPTAKLKSGPTYTPNGNIKATATALKKSATFRMSAEFDLDPPNGVLAACGEIRQYIRWSNNNVDPSRFGHEGFFTDKTYLPDTWYEDRDQPNTRFGHRRGPHSALNNAFDQYFDKAGKISPNPASGRFYEGRDTPNTSGSAAYISSFVGSWEFRLEAIDTCNGNKVLGSDNVKIQW
ncbi:MAG TPA: DUF4157 domain-containing protein [Candidatus Methanoperedens sp.]|nr:DUF4157 domain-containing protein [Candidatus Methanoperedens sp.]HLB71708.1 DUF4157 domain-containing protein [Candidatus Methanoperedens sp.]